MSLIRSAGIRSKCQQVYVDLYKWLFAILPTGLIMYKGLHNIHLSVLIYEWVGRYHGSRWPDRHVYIELLYGYLPILRSTSHPEYTYRAYHLYQYKKKRKLLNAIFFLGGGG